MIDKITLICFFAKWCGACKMQMPIIEELEKKFVNRIEFLKVDIDEHRDISNHFNVNATPTTLIVRNDIIFKKYVGLADINQLEFAMNNILKSN